MVGRERLIRLVLQMDDHTFNAVQTIMLNSRHFLGLFIDYIIGALCI